MTSALSGSTRKLYNRVWAELTNFCASYLHVSEAELPITITTLSLFYAHLFNKGYAPATLCTFNSAIGYFHKINNVQDPASSFFISKMLHGAKRSRPQFDCRLPITRPILHRLLEALPHVCSLPYYQTLYCSMFLVAFYALLRIGQITRNQNQQNSHCLRLSNVHSIPSGFILQFDSYKHSIPGECFKLLIEHQQDKAKCPVAMLKQYLLVRGSQQGYLFIHPNATSITRSQFNEILRNTLSFIGLSPTQYKGHSFRIGACTWLMKQGKSDSQIRQRGRWHSNAFLKYLRPDITS